MNAAQELLTRVHSLGIKVELGPNGKLRVSPPGKLSDELREQLGQREAELLALLTQQQESPWPCRHCGNPAEIEAVEPSRDGARMLTYWHCESCQTWGVTPDTLRQPPVWVSSKAQ